MKEILEVFKEHDIGELEELGYLRTVEGKIVFTEMFLNILTNTLIVSINIEKSSNLEALSSQLMEIFPEGKNFCGQKWRGSQAIIVDKLGKFKKKYKFSDEKIIEATKAYVKFFKSKNSYEGMRLLKFFIEKKDAGSDLAEWCENSTVKEVKESINKAL